MCALQSWIWNQLTDLESLRWNCTAPVDYWAWNLVMIEFQIFRYKITAMCTKKRLQSKDDSLVTCWYSTPSWSHPNSAWRMPLVQSTVVAEPRLGSSSRDFSEQDCDGHLEQRTVWGQVWLCWQVWSWCWELCGGRRAKTVFSQQDSWVFRISSFALLDNWSF